MITCLDLRLIVNGVSLLIASYHSLSLLKKWDRLTLLGKWMYNPTLRFRSPQMQMGSYSYYFKNKLMPYHIPLKKRMVRFTNSITVFCISWNNESEFLSHRDLYECQNQPLRVIWIQCQLTIFKIVFYDTNYPLKTCLGLAFYHLFMFMSSCLVSLSIWLYLQYSHATLLSRSINDSRL
jgi:hypothetical protein